MWGPVGGAAAAPMSFYAGNSLLLPFSYLQAPGLGYSACLPSPFLCFVPMPTGLAAAAPSCPQNVKISGGSFTVSHGWAPGSVLTYSCPPGRYPSPAYRLCLSNGRWQTPGSAPGTKAVCKREVLRGPHSGCPDSSELLFRICWD